MWKVYKGVNETQKEIYFGVSKDPAARVDGSHCDGGTKALKDWDCENDTINWSIVDTHDTQPKASSDGHAREKIKVESYTVIQTAGI